MKNPDRFTIIIEQRQKPDVILRKVKAILKEMQLDETQYRVYMDGNIKTVINVIIDSLFSEEFILEALNRQIRFVATNEKIRRIMALVSSDFDDDKSSEYETGKRENGKLTLSGEEIEEEQFTPLDNSTVKFAEMLQSEEPDKVVDDAEEMIEYGEEIIVRAKNVLINAVENEIKKAVKSTLNNPRNINKSMKVLKDLMSNKILNQSEFRELSQKAGFNAIKLLEKNNKYSDELIEILENGEVDDFVRMKSAIAYVESLKRRHYSFSEIKEKLNLDLIKEIYSRTKALLSPDDINVIYPIISK